LRRISPVSGVFLLLAFTVCPAAAVRVEVLRSIGGLPPHLVGQFEEAAAFAQAPDGTYFVFDARGHTIWTVDAARTAARKAVTIGGEPGRILDPAGFDLAPDGSFVVADVPREENRIQVFDPTGAFQTGFFISERPAARIRLGNMVLSGVGAIQHTGRSLLLSFPETGTVVTEYFLDGRTSTGGFGRLRATGHETEPDIHIAMNGGLPLVDPTGGYYFVFVAAQPMFRKYDSAGKLLFERHIEGREIDDVVANQPTQWPRRQVRDREIPIVVPVIRAAAVDARGQLWVSLAVPFTYVYDRDGDKARTLQFSAAGIISPTSLSFSRTGTLLVTPGCYEFSVD
jgi:hypothetical protein